MRSHLLTTCILFSVVLQAFSLRMVTTRGVFLDPANSIYPNIREKHCGHGNLEIPQLLRHEGKGQYIVDIGLGDDAGETFAAVRNNFVVFGFEPSPGNIANIKRIAQKSGDLQGKVQFVEPKLDESGAWIFPQIEKPETQGGFAYIFHAGLSDKEGTANMEEKQSLTGQIAFAKHTAPVAVTTLDKTLPDWASAGVHMVKIDTQGWELRILQGATNLIQNGRFKYIQYEFSPWLMKWASVDTVGKPQDLLSLLPNKGGMCFDMMGEHHKMSRPTSPLDAYFESLNSGKNSSYKKGNYKHDKFGPWEDITCYMQHGGSSVEDGIQQVLADVCVKQP